MPFSADAAAAQAPDDAELLYNRACIVQGINELAAIPVYERAASLAVHYLSRGERVGLVTASGSVTP
mgnify:CR=1 FL=1